MRLTENEALELDKLEHFIVVGLSAVTIEGVKLFIEHLVLLLDTLSEGRILIRLNTTIRSSILK